MSAGDKRHDSADKRAGNAWLVIVLFLILVPILYVLSVGPYTSVYGYDPPPRWAQIIYAPLIWIMERSETVRECIDWYGTFWLRESP